MLVGLTDAGRYYAGAGVNRNDESRKELLDHARRYKVDVEAIPRTSAQAHPKSKPKEKKPHARKRAAG